MKYSYYPGCTLRNKAKVLDDYARKSAIALGFQLDKLDAVLDHCGNPIGVPCYLPDNCQGEDNIQDFLGMCGLPVMLTPYWPENAESILLTRASACDPDVVEKLEKYVAAGGKALIKDIVLLVVGAALIAIGADLLVDNGTIIAEKLGVPESVIALTFVALGTSLPELVTAITSLAKGHGALSLGNIIGANLFNLVLVSGVSILLSPFTLPAGKMIAGMNASLVVDIPVMLGVMLILIVPSVIRGKLARWQGIALLSIYAAFCVFQFVL